MSNTSEACAASCPPGVARVVARLAATRDWETTCLLNRMEARWDDEQGRRARFSIVWGDAPAIEGDVVEVAQVGGETVRIAFASLTLDAATVQAAQQLLGALEPGN
jgi:hypothetical protein